MIAGALEHEVGRTLSQAHVTAIKRYQRPSTLSGTAFANACQNSQLQLPPLTRATLKRRNATDAAQMNGQFT